MTSWRQLTVVLVTKGAFRASPSASYRRIAEPSDPTDKLRKPDRAKLSTQLQAKLEYCRQLTDTDLGFVRSRTRELETRRGLWIIPQETCLGEEARSPMRGLSPCKAQGERPSGPIRWLNLGQASTRRSTPTTRRSGTLQARSHHTCQPAWLSASQSLVMRARRRKKFFGSSLTTKPISRFARGVFKRARGQSIMHQQHSPRRYFVKVQGCAVARPLMSSEEPGCQVCNRACCW